MLRLPAGRMHPIAWSEINRLLIPPFAFHLRNLGRPETPNFTECWTFGDGPRMDF